MRPSHPARAARSLPVKSIGAIALVALVSHPGGTPLASEPSHLAPRPPAPDTARPPADAAPRSPVPTPRRPLPVGPHAPEAPRSDVHSLRVVLGLVVNGRERGDIDAELNGDDVIVALADLHAAGLVGVRTATGAARVALSTLAPEVRFHLDHAAVALRLEAAPHLFGAHRFSLAPDRPAGIEYPRDTSGFLNYGLHADSSGGLSLFGELGLRLSDVFFGTTVSAAVDRAVVRGLSQLVIDQRDALVRWTLGDVFARSGQLGGATFLAGLTLARDFTLDPYFVAAPGLSFDGATSSPATVEVYLDDALVERLEVPAGRFRLEDLPLPSRGGDARYVVRDALGNTQSFERSYGVTQGVLERGLHRYAYSLGIERHAIASESFDYRDPVALGHHRVGLTDTITLGWRAEVAPLRRLGGGGLEATVMLPLGKLDLGLHGSTSEDGVGGAASIAWSFPGRTLGASLYGIGRTADYAVLGLERRRDRALAEAGALIDVGLGPFHGALEARLVHYRDGREVLNGRATVGATVTPGLSLQLGVAAAWHGAEAGVSAHALLSFVPGRGLAGTLSHRYDDDTGQVTTLATNVPLRDDSDAGVHTTLTRAHDRLGLVARPMFQTSFGRYQGHLSYDEEAGLFASLDAAGALVFVGGAGFGLTRPVTDAFAIVEVPDDVEVTVFRENHAVGRTSGGRLVVNDLTAYYGNRLSIAGEELGLDREVRLTERIVAPPPRGGARVSFDVTTTRYVRGRVVLRFADGGATPGEIVPAYGRIRVGTPPDALVTSPLGRNAEFELPGLPPGRHRAVIEHRGTTCVMSLVVPADAEPIADLGRHVCTVTPSLAK